MRSLILQGPLEKIRIDQVRRDLGPEIDVTLNSLPEDGVAIFDAHAFRDWHWPVEAAKTPDVTDTGRHKVTVLEGPDYTSSAIAWLKEGQLTQPPEEASPGAPE